MNYEILCLKCSRTLGNLWKFNLIKIYTHFCCNHPYVPLGKISCCANFVDLERNYHYFYQLCESPEVHLLLLENSLEEIYITFKKLSIDFGHVAHVFSNISIIPKLGIINSLFYRFLWQVVSFNFLCLKWLVYLLERFCVVEIVVTFQKWSSFFMK